MKKIRLAIVGTGGMARGHAGCFQKIKGVEIVAACDVDRKRVDAFGLNFGIPRTFTDVGAMLKEVEFDAVSVVTTDAGHAPVSLQAIAAGKHVLCEKPLATCYADAKKMADAAKKKGVINMVNFSYRNSSALHKCAEMVRAGKIGRVMHFEASYLQSWLSSKVWGDWRADTAWLWRLSTKHGSKGVLGDVGVHILDLAGYPVGAFKSVNCKLKTFSKIKGERMGEYVLDANDSAVITVEAANGAIGTVHTTRWATGHQNSLLLRLYGDKGAIELNLDKSYGELQVCLGKDVDKAAWQTVVCKGVPNMYERFIRSIRTGKNDQPDFARGAEVQKVLDACIESDKTGKTIRL